MGCIPKSNFEKILGELHKLGIQDVDTNAIDKALVSIRKQRGSFQGLRKRDFVDLIIANLNASPKENIIPGFVSKEGVNLEHESQEENNNSSETRL